MYIIYTPTKKKENAEMKRQGALVTDRPKNNQNKGLQICADISSFLFVCPTNAPSEMDISFGGGEVQSVGMPRQLFFFLAGSGHPEHHHRQKTGQQFGKKIIKTKTKQKN